jgi:TP901 family phage tail tape measure protein
MKLYEYVFQLQDKVSGTMKKISAAQDKASSKFDKLRNKTAQFGQKLRDAASEIPGFDSAMRMITNPFVLLTAGALAMGTIFTSLTSKAADFNQEMVSLRNLNLDKTDQQLGQLNDKILNLSIAEGLDPKETTKAFYDIQSATGLYGDEVEDLTRTIGRYSIATGAKMSDSINSATKAMKAFGLQSSEVEGLLESNAKTVQVGITTFDELAKVQTEYAGAASAAGQSVDTSNKLFAAFTAVAKDSAQAATLTKGAFQGLTQKNTIDGLQSIGVSLFDTEGKMRDMDGVIRELTPKLQQMSDQQFSELSNAIGGPEGLRALFNQLKSSGDDVIGMLDAFDRSEFSINDALENAKGDFNTLKEIIGNQLNAVMIQLGQMILPPLIRGLDFIHQLIKNGRSLWQENAEAIKFWGQIFLIAFSPVIAGLTLSAIKFTVMGIAAAAAAVKTGIFTAAQWLLNAAMLANPIGLIIAGIAALIALVTVIIRKYDEWGAAITLAMGPLGAVINLVQSFRRNWEDVKSSFTDGGIIAGLKKIGAVILDALLMPIQQLLELVAKIPGLGDLAGNGADYINDLRKKLGVDMGGNSTSERDAGREAFTSGAASYRGIGSQESLIPEGGNLSLDGKSKKNDIKKGTESIIGGGKKQTNITINIQKLNESINVSTTNLNEGLGEIEDKIMETLLRAVNGANYTAS